MTGFARVVFPNKSNGSLVERNGRVVGSKLVAQEFTSPRYFHERPSATSPDYNAAATTFANLGPTNPDLAKNVRAAALAAILDARAPVQPRPDDRRHSGRRGHDLGLRASTRTSRRPTRTLQAARIAAVRGLPLRPRPAAHRRRTPTGARSASSASPASTCSSSTSRSTRSRHERPAQRLALLAARSSLAAIRDSFAKLDPRRQFRNPVIFIVELGSVDHHGDLLSIFAATRLRSGSSGVSRSGSG